MSVAMIKKLTKFLTLACGFLIVSAHAPTSDPRAAHALVELAYGVMIRVPRNFRGEVNTDAAQMRVAREAAFPGSDIAALWRDAVDVSKQPRVDVAAARDGGATSWGWIPWGNFGWCADTYYLGYRPSYVFYGTSYHFGRPYSQSAGSYYYYYYPRWWW